MKREPFRHTNFLSDVCKQSITGLGAAGYILALDAAAAL
jgi:3-dehydroquinate dehydratase